MHTPPRLRLQHRGVREAHGRLPRDDVTSASRASSSATPPARTSCSRSPSAPPTALFSERPTAETLTAAIQRYRPTVVTNVPTMIGKLLDRRRAARRGQTLDLQRALPPLRRRGPPRSAPPPLHRAVRRRRLRRHRLGRDVPHLLLEPPGRHQARLPRPRRRGLQLRSCPPRRPTPGEPELAPRRDRRAVGQGRQRRARLLPGSRQELEDLPRPLVPDGDLFTLDERGLPLVQGRADDLLKVGGIFVAPIEVEDCLLAHPPSPSPR
jgi:acyl-CoA synthetase (AMP-forming)/AMP-acid ligase II